MKDLITLKEDEEYKAQDYQSNGESCEISTSSTSKDTLIVIVKPAIADPGRTEMMRKCKKVRNAVILREREVRSEAEAEDEEECNLTVISDTEGTSISMTHTVTPPVENDKNIACKHLGIDPRLASLVTLYEAEDAEDTEILDKCAPARPEVPEDFVPRCGRESMSD